MPDSVRVLLTAFGPFPGAPVNPTPAITAACFAHRRRFARLGVTLTVPALLPVVYAEIASVLDDVLERERPNIVLMLGLAGRRRALSVESRALNRVSRLRPDARRGFPATRRIKHEGPGLYRAPLASQRLVAAMARTGAPTQYSIDAGDYLCNAALYTAVASGIGRAVFVHVPRPASPGRRKSRRVARPAMVKAVEAAIIACAIAVRRDWAVARNRDPVASCGTNAH